MEINIRKSKRKATCYHVKTSKFHEILKDTVIAQIIHHGSSGTSTEIICLDEMMRRLKQGISSIKKGERDYL